MQFSDPSQHQRHSYGASKYLDEVAAQHAARDGLDVRIVRPFNAYGPRLNGGDYGQVVAMFFNSILTSSTLHIHNNGSQTRSFTWIDDITEGFLKAGLLDEGVSGESLSGMAFNIGSTEEISILDLQKRVYEVVNADSNWSLPLPEIEFTEGYHGDATRRWPDVSLAKQHLGWTASTNLIQGLQSTWIALR